MDKWLEEYIEIELEKAEKEDFYDLHTQNYDAIETWINLTPDELL